MKSRFPTLIVLILVTAVGLLAYFLGRKNGGTVVENIVTNEAIVKEISELSSLEVRGNASIRHSNVTNDGSWSDAMRKFFLENTLNISVPFVAKYGVNLDQQEVKVLEANKTVMILLPEPQLLSYELRLDQINTSSREGLLFFQNHDYFTAIQKSLYTKSRAEMESSAVNKQRAKDKIIETLATYYQPTGYRVEVRFGEDSPVSIIKEL